MIAEDVKTIFKPYVLSEDYLDIGNGQFVSIDFFIDLFGNVSTPPTFDDLMSVDCGTRGYAEFFARCKSEGLFN